MGKERGTSRNLSSVEILDICKKLKKSDDRLMKKTKDIVHMVHVVRNVLSSSVLMSAMHESVSRTGLIVLGRLSCHPASPLVKKLIVTIL